MTQETDHFFIWSKRMNFSKHNDFDYNLIKVMNEVITSGNLSRAALNLNLSISAVSLSISKLQRQLGTELFVRTSQGLKPTDDALQINQVFLHALDLINDGLLTLNDNVRGQSSLNVTCPDLFEHYYLQNLYQQANFSDTEFKFNHHIKCSHDEYVDCLLQSFSDLIISDFPLRNEKVTSTLIDSLDDFVVVVSQSSLLANQKKVTLAHYHMIHHAVYTYNAESLVNYSCKDNCSFGGRNTAMVKVGYHSSSINGVISAVEHRGMLAILPRKIVGNYINHHHSNIVMMELPDEVCCKKICIYANYKKKKDKVRGMESIVSSICKSKCEEVCCHY
jgi:DNA-binding transcriptional LysR family regulator